MSRNRSAVFALLLAVLLCGTWPAAAYKAVDDITDDHEGPRLLVIPYAFKTESSGSGFGVGASYSGWPQKQAIIGGTVWRNADHTGAVYLNLTDYQLPFARRFFLFVHGIDSSNDTMISYPSGPGGGRNDSKKDSFHKGHGWDQWVETEVSYVLPWGPYGDEPIHTYVTDRGLLKEGGVYRGVYDPFESGRSFLKMKPYYRHRWFRGDAASDTAVETAGVRLTFEYDNSDFVLDPNQGSRTILHLYQGVDAGKSDAWTGIELDFSSYWSLGETPWFAKQVAAINMWAFDTPSWDEHDDGSVSGDSPYYMGGFLGGHARQRGYPFYRFHDKAAVNYAFEYRVMPRWVRFHRFSGANGGRSSPLPR